MYEYILYSDLFNIFDIIVSNTTLDINSVSLPIVDEDNLADIDTSSCLVYTIYSSDPYEDSDTITEEDLDIDNENDDIIDEEIDDNDDDDDYYTDTESLEDDVDTDTTDTTTLYFSLGIGEIDTDAEVLGYFVATLVDSNDNVPKTFVMEV